VGMSKESDMNNKRTRIPSRSSVMYALQDQSLS